MSFLFIPAGLHRLPHRTDGTGSSSSRVPIFGLAGDATQNCPGFGGGVVICPGPDDGVGSFSVSLSAIPFDTGGDYFAVKAWVRGPSLGGASCIPALTPTSQPCSTSGEAHYDGTVSGTWVKAIAASPGYEALDPDYTASNVASLSFDARTDWPAEASDHAFLVNSSPPWPAPDGAGNEFGMCLFTLAQLPAAIETEITFHSYDEPIRGELAVAVSVYMLEDPGDPGADGRRGQIVGHA